MTAFLIKFVKSSGNDGDDLFSPNTFDIDFPVANFTPLDYRFCYDQDTLINYNDSSYIINEALFGISFALCAGIMVYVALNELLPVAKDYGEPSDAIIGVTIGMIIMALSLIMMYS